MADYNRGSYSSYGNQSKGFSGKGSNTGVRASIPAGYLENGYNGADGVMDIKLITSIAEQIGKSLGNDSLTGVSKIRSFYDEVTSILTDCTYGETKWTIARNNLAMLKARANVRFEKGTASKLFLDFISKNVTLVTNSKDETEFKSNLRNFKDHFEAVVCYLPKK